MSTTALMIPPTVRIPLDKEGFFAVVDEADAPRILQHQWRVSGNKKKRTYYAIRYDRGGRCIRMHWAIKHCPRGKRLDHINGDGLCNTRRNLRIATFAENARNKIKKRAGGTSKYKGVSWDKSRGLWRVMIMKDYKAIFVGRAKTQEEAANIYNLKAKELHGDFAKENQIQDLVYGSRRIRVVGKNSPIRNFKLPPPKKMHYKVAFNGKAQWLPAWAKELGLPHQALRKRLDRGWSTEKAFTTPISTQHSYKMVPGVDHGGKPPLEEIFVTCCGSGAPAATRTRNRLIRSQTQN